MKRIFGFFIAALCSVTLMAEWVDLGLPSGTQWKSVNEQGPYYSYEEAMAKFGRSLPTKEQWEELQDQCTWMWTGKGYTVVGINGNSIYLPAAGLRICSGKVIDLGSGGNYWSTEKDSDDSEYAYGMDFEESEYMVMGNACCLGLSIRLVR